MGHGRKKGGDSRGLEMKKQAKDPAQFPGLPACAGVTFHVPVLLWKGSMQGGDSLLQPRCRILVFTPCRMQLAESNYNDSKSRGSGDQAWESPESGQ